MAIVWLPINSDRQVVTSQVDSAVGHVKRCRAAGGSSSVCDAAAQALLDDIASSGPTLTCCRMLVNIVVSVAAELTPVTSDALQRALIVRPEAYRYVISDALLYTRDLNRIRPLLRFLLQDEKYAPLWTDLHSRLVLFAKFRAELAFETLRFLCDVHNTMYAASYHSLHSGFISTFHDESTMELADAIFDLDINVFGADACLGLASQLVAIVLNRLCSEEAVFPACRVLLYIFSLDITLATDVRIIAILSWVLRFHAGLQTDRDLRFLLETIFVCVHSFDKVDVGIEFNIAVTSLLPPLLELLSSNSEWLSVLSRASRLFDDLQQCRNRPTIAVPLHELRSKTFIDTWNLGTLSGILHVFNTLVSAWPNLDYFVRECSKKPCRTEYEVRAAHFIIDTIFVCANSKVIQSTAFWMQELTKAYAFEFLPLFSSMLYRLRNDHDGDVRIKLLYAFPHIARSPMGVTRVLRIILPLTQHKRLRCLSIRLLSHLWLVEPRSFSRLQQILLETWSQTNTIAIKRAIAASLIDICRQSATEALSLVPLLQTLLYDKDTIIVALSIEALRELCVQGELDLHVAYQLLEDRGLRQFCVGKNPIAFKQLFRLLECDDVEGDDTDGISSTMIRWLWQQTSLTTSLSAALRSAAYESLIVLAERSLEKVTPNYVIRFVCDWETTRELVIRMQDEKSGRVRIVLERFVGVVCTLQLQHSSSISKKEPSQNGLEAFAVTFPAIVKQASNTVVKQWRDNERPSVRDVFSISALIDPRRETPLSELIVSITAPNLSSVTDIFISFALPAAWSRYMDRFASDVLHQKRDSDLSGNSLYLSVFDHIEKELQSLDLGDSRIRGNVIFSKAGLALKAGAWGHTDIATRLHSEILSVATEAKNALMQTTRPAALLALGTSIAALHPTDTDRRSAAFKNLFELFRSSSDERIVTAACLSIAIGSTAFLKDEGGALDAAGLLKESFDVVYGYLKASTSDSIITATAGVALWLMWPVLVRVIPFNQFTAIHEDILQKSRFGLACNASLYYLGGLSSRLFSMGVIDADKLAQVVDVYIDELKKPAPLPGALIASSMFLISLRYASNYVGLPRNAPQQLGARLVELISQSDAQPITVASAIIGFVALLGIDILIPFQGARLPTDLCSDGDFTANVTEIFSHSLVLLTTTAFCSHEVAVASALCLVFLGAATSSTTRAMDSQCTFTPGTLLRIICDYIDKRSAPSNITLSSIIRSISEIRRYARPVHLPLPVSTLSSLLSATANDVTISILALRTAIVKLMLWQASYDNTLKRSVAALINTLKTQPVCIQRVLLTGLNDVVNCVDTDSVLSLLSSSLLPNVDSLLIGLRRVLESAVDQTVRDCAVQLLGSARLRSLVTDIPRYAACFTVLDPDLIESILPVDDDVSILTRLELVHRNILHLNVLIATRAFIVGPQALRPALVEKFAQICAESFPVARRLTWILDLFDLMSAAGDPSPALRAIIITVTAWVYPMLPGDIRTLAGCLPKALEGYDDMSVDSVIRRLLRVVNPPKDDVTWNDEIRRSLVPSAISLAVAFPRCSPVITSDMFSVI